ncbi:MAG: SPOR domain-containing protein [Pseudogulbenkiania sp.]|nr:SPOR domain-containing protein [Pseudogulbenkiania sp.]
MPGLSTHEELILLRKRARRRLVGAVVLVLISTVVLWKVVGSVPEQQMKPESVEIVGQNASDAPAPATPAPEAVLAAGADVGPQEDHAASAAAATQLPARLEDAEPAVAAQPQARPLAPVAPVPAAKAELKPPLKEESKPQPKVEHKPEPKKTEALAPAPKKADPAAILEGRLDAEPAAAKFAPKAESRPAEGKVVIQLAALSDPAKAEALKSRLSGLGVTAHFSKVETSKGNVTRVRVGPFNSRAEAEAVMKKLSSAGVTGIIVGR